MLRHMLRKGVERRGFGMIGMIIAMALLAGVFILYSQRYLDVLLNMTGSSQTQGSALQEALPQTQTGPGVNTRARIETRLKQSLETKMKGDDFYLKQIEGMQH